MDFITYKKGKKKEVHLCWLVQNGTLFDDASNMFHGVLKPDFFLWKPRFSGYESIRNSAMHTLANFMEAPTNSTSSQFGYATPNIPSLCKEAEREREANPNPKL